MRTKFYLVVAFTVAITGIFAARADATRARGLTTFTPAGTKTVVPCNGVAPGW